MLRSLSINNRNFSFYLFKAKVAHAPILIIFHGAGFNKVPAKFRDDRINVVAIMDTFGDPDIGSWYLGEKGDFFWIEGIGQIIELMKQECRTNQVFCWGSSMGGVCRTIARLPQQGYSGIC